MDEMRLGHNVVSMVVRLNALGYKVSNKDFRYIDLLKENASLVYKIDIHGFGKMTKIDKETRFYLEHNLKSNLVVIIKRTFLGITIWKEMIIGTR